jgi:hypothetical protein
MVTGFALFAVAIFFGRPLIGLLAGGCAVTALACWRKRDHNRVDYVRIAWRRLRSTRGVYSPVPHPEDSRS